MISVCIATYNGEKYIREQLESILPQLGNNDEVIISDDSSTDKTLEFLYSYNDPRIKIFSHNKFHSPIFNFENALKKAQGDFIFLSDQDDVWMPDKIARMMEALDKFSLVVSNAYVVDQDCHIIRDSFFAKEPSRCVLKNLIRNNFIGCCMAFRRDILETAIPFPKHIAMHDIWLGLCGALFHEVCFIPDKLIMYRRHGKNASPSGERSRYSIVYRIRYRLYLVYHLITRYFFKVVSVQK